MVVAVAVSAVDHLAGPQATNVYTLGLCSCFLRLFRRCIQGNKAQQAPLTGRARRNQLIRHGHFFNRHTRVGKRSEGGVDSPKQHLHLGECQAVCGAMNISK